MDDFHTVSFPGWYPVVFFSMWTLPLVPTYIGYEKGKALSIQIGQSDDLEVKERVYQQGFTLCYNLNIPSVTQD